MISVKELNKWAQSKAIGRSFTVPNGWIDGKDLLALAEIVTKLEPMNYDFVIEDIDATL